MERDIHKFADWLVERVQAGVAIEHKILEWKTAEKKKEVGVKMQIWSKFKIEYIEDTKVDTNAIKYSTKKVILSGVDSDDIKIEVCMRNPDDFMLSQLFDKRIGEEVEVRFTAGDMLKKIEEREND